MRTDVDALAYVKEHTFINEAGRSYQSGERMDKAIAIKGHSRTQTVKKVYWR